MYKVKSKLFCVLATVLAFLCGCMIFSNVTQKKANAENTRANQLEGIYATDIIDWQFRYVSNGEYVPHWNTNGAYFKIGGCDDTTTLQNNAAWTYGARVPASSSVGNMLSIANGNKVSIKFNVYMGSSTSNNVQKRLSDADIFLEDSEENYGERIDLIIHGYSSSTKSTNDDLAVSYSTEIMRVRLDYFASSSTQSIMRVLPYVGVVQGSDVTTPQDWRKVFYGKGYSDSSYKKNKYGANRDLWVTGKPQKDSSTNSTMSYYFEFDADNLLSTYYNLGESGKEYSKLQPILDSAYEERTQNVNQTATTGDISQKTAYTDIKNYITNNSIEYISFDISGDNGFTGDVGVEILELNGQSLANNGTSFTNKTDGVNTTLGETERYMGLAKTVDDNCNITAYEEYDLSSAFTATSKLFKDTSDMTYSISWEDSNKQNTGNGNDLVFKPKANGLYTVTLKGTHAKFGSATKTFEIYIVDMRTKGASIRFTDGAFRIVSMIKEEDYKYIIETESSVTFYTLAAPVSKIPTPLYDESKKTEGLAIMPARQEINLSDKGRVQNGYVMIPAVILDYSISDYKEQTYKTNVATRICMAITSQDGTTKYDYGPVANRSFSGVINSILDEELLESPPATGDKDYYFVENVPTTSGTVRSGYSQYTPQQMGKVVAFYNTIQQQG